MRPTHILQILDREFATTDASVHTPVMLWGPPGVGKSQIIGQIATGHGAPLIDIRLSQMEPTDLRGIPFRSGDRVEWSVPALLPDAKRHGARGPWTFQPWEPVALPREAGGGGGTCFAPVFDWIAAERRRPDLLLYFTDADGEFPRYAPDYPVIWLVKGKSRVPWGERIQLN